MSLGAKDDTEMDDTPTGAMRKLMGSSTRVTSGRMADKHGQSINLGPGMTSPSKPRSVSSDGPTVKQSGPIAPQLDEKQVQALLALLASTACASEKTKLPDEKSLLDTLEDIEKAEKKAEAREMRLRNMLEEVSYCLNSTNIRLELVASRNNELLADDRQRSACWIYMYEYYEYGTMCGQRTTCRIYTSTYKRMGPPTSSISGMTH